MYVCRYGADIDCQTKSKYTPLHRCAYYNHQRLAGLLVMAGATQQLPDEHQQTAYHVAVAQQHYEIASLLKPVYDAQGKDITGLQYLLNNPKHSQYRSESREIFFQLFVMEQNLQQQKELTMQQLQAVATQPPLQYRPYPLHPLAVQQAGPALSFPSSFTSSSSSSSRHVAIGSNRPLDIKAHDKNHEEDDIRNEEVEKEETADDERRSQHKGKRCLTMRHSTKSKKKR